jgi:hypothetical protein
MSRALDATLTTALASQKGELILRVNTWSDAADYAANPATPDHTWIVKSFDILATEAKATLVTENNYTLSAFEVFTIERGVRYLGTDYTIQSGLFFVEKYQEDFGEIRIEGSSYPNQKISIAAGDGTYQEVIEAFCAAIGKTAVFKNTTDQWLNYQFFPTGKSLSLNKAKLFENLLRQKYCILVYEESPNNLVFYNQDSYPANAFKAVAWNESNTLAAVATAGTVKATSSPNGETWTDQSAPAYANDIAYSSSLGLFVAVGASVCHTSPDGVTWTPQAIPAGTYHAIAWSSSLNLFVAVGVNVCATSANGTAWTARSIPTGTYIGVTWSPALTIFVAIADKIVTSANGITWSTNPQLTNYAWVARTAAEANTWYSIAWSPSLGLFAAVASDGTHQVMTSPDGLTWTPQHAAEANTWINVIWSPELALFCAVSNNGTNRVMTSPDGVTWTAQAASEANVWCSVCWSADLTLFVAVSADGANRVMTSPDGGTWTHQHASEANQWRSVCWSTDLGLFCAVSFDGAHQVMTSPDGITWTAQHAAANETWINITWSPELALFCAVSYSGKIMTSPDGVTWTSQIAPEPNMLMCVAWAPEPATFVAVSLDGTHRAITSPNGVDWTAQHTAEDNQWRGVCWSPELRIFAAVSGTGTNRVQTWQTNYYSSLKAVAWSPSLALFTAVGVSQCYTSANGLTFTSRAIPAGTYNAITFGDDVFVAVGTDVAASSINGADWTARTPATLNTWQDVIYCTALDLFVAVANDGTNRVMTSTDGVTWSNEPAEADFALSYLDGPHSYLVRDQAAVHFLWRDELAATHTDGSTALPQWNLGYLETGCDPPITREDAYYKIYLLKAPIRLDITDGDKINFTPYWSIDPARTIDSMMQVSEHLHLEKSPAWYQEIKSIIMFNATEGGALPGTIERVAAYTPLVSINFDGNLTPDVNNLQALAQAVDDLDLTGGGEHHALTGLLDDDHTQYINTTRGDLRYSLITQTHLAILAAAPTVAIAETVFAFNTLTAKFYLWDGFDWNLIATGTPLTSFALLLEDDVSFLLLEDGSKILME